MGVIGEAVRGIDDLGLQKRLADAKILLKLRPVLTFAVLGHGFQGFPGEIEPGKVRVAILQVLDDPQGV